MPVRGVSQNPGASPPGVGDPSDFSTLDPALEKLIETAARSLQAGDPPDVDQLAADHPAWADTIRQALAAMAELAGLGLDLARTHSDPLDRRDFGDFRILREIDRGGMGVVYEAEQLSLRRRVALKILPLAAALDDRALRRFQLEAQVAGLLQHPRIVPVHAVGSVDQIPFFAMQFIEGCNLAALIADLLARSSGVAVEFQGGNGADQAGGPGPHSGSLTGSGDLAAGLLSGRFAIPRGDSAAEVLTSHPTAAEDPDPAEGPPPIRGRSYVWGVARLGLQAAEALAYAHEQGVIHRDVKPANLLMDRRGNLWVADFGMADVSGDPGLTRTGDLPGTLRYMSPEQATGTRALVDRRTDVYGLGATLYELLTLRPAVPGLHQHEVLRRILDAEPTPLRKLNPGVPRDLATIVAKALAKDPARRYETALAMAEDLSRFLDGRPVKARPTGPIVKSWRWCRRKPAIAGLAASLVLALVAGVAGITWSWRDAVHQRQAARIQAARADAVNGFLIDKLLLQANPELTRSGVPVTLAQVLDHGAAELAASFRDQPETEASVRVAISQAYHGIGKYTQAADHARAAYQLLDARPVSKPADRIRALAEWGHELDHLNRFDEAEPLLRTAYSQSRALLGDHHVVTAVSAEYLGFLCENRQDFAQAEAYLRRALDASRIVRGLDQPATLDLINSIAWVVNKQGRHAEAEVLHRQALAVDLKSQVSRNPWVLGNLGQAVQAQGRLEEAESLIRRGYQACKEILGPNHSNTLATQSKLGEILAQRGQTEEAERILKSCLETQRRLLGPGKEATLLTSQRLANLHKDRPSPPHALIPTP